METSKRAAAKALTWQTTGLVAMTGLGYLVSGSLETAGQLAVGSTALGLVLYFLHEKAWARIRWGRR